MRKGLGLSFPEPDEVRGCLAHHEVHSDELDSRIPELGFGAGAVFAETWVPLPAPHLELMGGIGEGLPHPVDVVVIGHFCDVRLPVFATCLNHAIARRAYLPYHSVNDAQNVTTATCHGVIGFAAGEYSLNASITVNCPDATN